MRWTPLVIFPWFVAIFYVFAQSIVKIQIHQDLAGEWCTYDGAETACPNNGTELVYKGRIGGDNQYDSGGGANYVCLPKIPKYADTHVYDILSSERTAFISGTQYYSSYLSKWRIHKINALCVACHVETRSSMLMIPARNDCPAGWTREYHGFLMAEHYGHKNNKEFICVDQHPDITTNTTDNPHSAKLSLVEGVCGSLPCRPYVNGWKLTCAVCTK